MTHYFNEKDYGVALDGDKLDRYSSIESLLIQTLIGRFHSTMDCTELEMRDQLSDVLNRYFKFSVDVSINPNKPPNVKYRFTAIPETHTNTDRKIDFCVYKMDNE